MSRRRRLVALGVVAVLLIAVPVGLATTADPPPAGPPSRNVGPPPPPPIAVRVTVGAPGRAIPPSFLGLSTEYWSLPLFEAHPAAFVRVLSLLRVPADGPLMMRIGGDSADQSLWDPPAHAPRWVFRLSRGWLGGTSRLLARVRLRLILDLNLVTASPLGAADWAHAALAGLPRGSISAFEIGNEPDLYDREYWLATIARTGAVLPAAISPRSYLETFDAYARALHRFAADVPLMGPAVAKPTRSLAWLRLLAARAPTTLGALTAHRYPYSACAAAGTSAYPTIDRLLSTRAVQSIVRAVAPAVRVAHDAGLPLRLTELNSVTCGGRPRVSDTFATAVWAPSALFALLAAGVDSVDIHVRARTVNAAFVPVRAGIAARPLLYGLALFTQALVHGGHLAITHVYGTGSALRAWAVRGPGGRLRLLLVDPSGRAARVRLPVALGPAARVLRLRAAGPSARSGERLAGQWLDGAGRWRGRLRVEHPQNGRIALPGYSAALVLG